jgi:hypothetical protein
MRRIAFTLFLSLLAASGAGFAALGLRGRLLPAGVASPELQFEFLAAGALLLLWGILQLALAGREEKPPRKAAPPAEAPAAESPSEAARIIESRAARMHRLDGGRPVAPPDSYWN